MPEKSFTIEGRAKQLPDVQRNWLWELEIPRFSDVTGKVLDAEGLIIRCRATSLPPRGNEVIPSNFMGMIQYFAGKPSFGNTFSVTIEEFEDQKVTQALYAWHRRIFDHEPSIEGGVSQASQKRGNDGYATDVFLIPYAYDGAEVGAAPRGAGSKKFKFVNAFLQNVGEVSMSYEGNESVKYECTFQFDYWQLV